jgi:hypothetical protein
MRLSVRTERCCLMLFFNVFILNELAVNKMVSPGQEKAREYSNYRPKYKHEVIFILFRW